MHEQTTNNKIRFKYNKSPDFHSYYINGAKGGIVGNYDFKMILYTDRMTEPVEEYVEDGSTPVPTFPEDIKDGELTVQRDISCEIMMSIPTLVEMRNFLDRIISNSDIIKKE